MATMHVVMLTADLMLTSSAQGVVMRYGGVMATASSADNALLKCQDLSAAALVVDLNTRGLEIGELVNRVRQECCPVPIVCGVSPHVHENLLAAARDAGFGVVMTRGEFERRLDDTLKELDGS